MVIATSGMSPIDRSVDKHRYRIDQISIRGIGKVGNEAGSWLEAPYPHSAIIRCVRREAWEFSGPPGRLQLTAFVDLALFLIACKKFDSLTQFCSNCKDVFFEKYQVKEQTISMLWLPSNRAVICCLYPHNKI